MPDPVATAFLTLLILFSLALTWIDLRQRIIPNWLNAAIAIAGLARAALLGGWPALSEAAAEAIVIGAVVWLLRWLYATIRKVQGLGLGDVKLLAASGIWIGIAGVPTQLLIAALTALAAAGILHLAGRAMTRRTAIPFGPFLALGLVVTFALADYGWLAF